MQDSRLPARIPQFVSNVGDLKWKRLRDLSHSTWRSVQRRRSTLHSRLLLGSTAISRRLYVCTSYVEEYRCGSVKDASDRGDSAENARGGYFEAPGGLHETADPLTRS